MPTVYHVWRSRIRNGQPERQLVNGADGKPVTFKTPGEAAAAAGVYSRIDSTWVYSPGGPVTTEG